jgi:phosphatidylethanolamine/phosphatidyl-N-methylethanolamine N-methyltransferase
MPLPANETRLSWPQEPASRHWTEPFLFLRSLLNDPLRIGALAPSSPKLSRLMASRVCASDDAVLEIGAGTGSITRALLETGLRPERLIAVERDPSLAAFLEREFPRVRVCCGDARDASRILHGCAIPPVKTVVSSLPLRNMPQDDQQEVVRAMVGALAQDGELIQFTYAAGCPVQPDKLGLRAECLGRVWLNLPPAAVWRFTAAQ